MVSCVDILEVLVSIFYKSIMISDPIALRILNKGNIIPSASIKNGQMVEFGVGISIIKPIDSKPNIPKIFLRPKNAIIFSDKGFF